jgi:hypothetical protein
MPYRDQRGAIEVHGKYFKKDMYHGLRRLVKDRMINVTRLEKELTRSINNGFIRQHIRHVAGGHLSDPRTHVIVFANMSTRGKRQFGYSQFVLAIDFAEEAGERRLELDLGD